MPVGPPLSKNDVFDALTIMYNAGEYGIGYESLVITNFDQSFYI